MIGDASSAVKASCDLSMLRRAMRLGSGKTPAGVAHAGFEPRRTRRLPWSVPADGSDTLYHLGQFL